MGNGYSVGEDQKKAPHLRSFHKQNIKMILRSAHSFGRFGNARRSSPTMVDYKEHVLFAGLFLFVAGMCGTQFYFLNGKIAAFRSEMRADFALIRADNAQFRSEILKTQSYLTKMLMKHDGETAKLSERSVV